MRIILAEERHGRGASERTFDQEIIRIGRDLSVCEIAFDNAEFPMVSRKHAELRFQDGRWLIADQNSSYGTFVDGRRITAPRQLTAGNRIQFGIDGPVVRVIRFEDRTPASIDPNQTDVLPAALAGKYAAPQLEFVEGDRKSFPLSQKDIWFGRDPDCDVVFEASAVMVSRKHAGLKIENGAYIVEDNNSFNGTLVNEQRISAPTPVFHGDEIRLGMGGPILLFISPSHIRPPATGELTDKGDASRTMVFRLGRESAALAESEAQLLKSLVFGDKKELTIGREEGNDIPLDGLQISNRHARLLQSNGSVVIDDLNSTNGVYVNGERISRQQINSGDTMQIGSFLLQIDAQGGIGVFDTRSKTRIDAVGISKTVKNRGGSGTITLLDGVSLSIRPNEFVGFLGPSGAGKSMLMDALNGMRPASSGNVLINHLDLYQHLDSLKQAIGYVPQDDIIHRELTVYRTLYYVAKLRLSRDVSRAEIDRTIDEVLDVTGLSERRDVPVSQLSGGQRKRVSIAVELLTKPSIIFLDEPTSGLDPATEEKIMSLFRQIAESGRTVILTTHAMENVRLFDRIVLLMQGRLVFYGRPQEALEYFNASSFKDLYDKLEEPVERAILEQGEIHRRAITQTAAAEWKKKFLQTAQYKQNVYEPLKELGKLQPAAVHAKRGLGPVGAFRQWLTLSRRYLQVLFADKLNLFILFVQAPIIAALTFFVMGENLPRDFVYFVLALVAVWFGTSVSAREIIRERPVYNRERMVNLGILPYVASKLFVLGIIVGLQCLLVFVPLKFFDLTGAMPMPGEMLGIPQFSTMLLTAGLGIALGLLISALVKTSEMATSLVPLILIPQILFSGIVGMPSGITKVLSLAVPAAWSFDTMKRFSTLGVLESENEEQPGLLKKIERDNEKMILDARKNLQNHQTNSEKKLKEFEDKLRIGERASMPALDEPPAIPNARKIPVNLSGYVTFLHPWMDEVLNQIVLMLMLGMLVIATLIVLRLQDIG